MANKLKISQLTYLCVNDKYCKSSLFNSYMYWKVHVISTRPHELFMIAGLFMIA